MEIIDNVNKTLKEDLTTEIHKGSKVSIAAACFSMYAYNELKKQLQEVQREFLHLKQARGMAEKAACLAIVLGISRAVANIIAPTCAAACLAVPLVCAACITGFVALAGGAIGGVVACFKL